MMPLDNVDLVLASTSRYRRELLTRLTQKFRCVAPHVDETPLSHESPQALAMRLAIAKADEVATRNPRALVIGSDQVAELEGRIFGKPGSASAAEAQLHTCSGRQVNFHTAVCIAGSGVQKATGLDTTSVRLRTLGADEITRYIEREQPFDCAGSFKIEALGITLFESVESRDPSALIGLPLIALCGLLRAAGIRVL